MAAPRLTAKIGRKTKVRYDEDGNRVGGGTTVSAKQVIGSINDYYDTTLVVQENNAAVIAEAINDAIVAAMEEIGLVAEGAAKRLCPVDTGRLRNSITHAFLDEHTVAIGTNVEYAPYVHNGTSTRKGRPFLVEAANNNQGRFNSIMRKHLQGG